MDDPREEIVAKMRASFERELEWMRKSDREARRTIIGLLLFLVVVAVGLFVWRVW